LSTPLPAPYEREFLFLAKVLRSSLVETYRVVTEANEPLTASEINKRLRSSGVISSYQQTYANLRRLLQIGLLGKLGKYYYAKHLKSNFTDGLRSSGRT